MTTFVSALINPNEVRPPLKSFEKYINNFKILANTKVKLHVFLSAVYVEKFQEEFHTYDNICFDIIELDELLAYKELKDQDGIQYDLPKIRCAVKDSATYIIIQHSKIQFVKLAMERNNFNSTHFCWIDFGIAHMMQEPIKTLSYLNSIPFNKCVGIHFAGLKIDNTNWEDFHNVNFRYAGSLFFGDRETLNVFYDLTRKTFSAFVKEYRILTWEVNFWCYLEKKYSELLLFNRYLAWHNDTIIKNITF